MRKFRWRVYRNGVSIIGDDSTQGIVRAKTSKEARRKATKASGTRNWGSWKRYGNCYKKELGKLSISISEVKDA